MGMLSNVVVNWKTTAFGILAFLQVLIVALMATLDSNPETIPDWNAVVTGLIVMIGLLLARDNDKSSEDQISILSRK